MTFGSRIFRSLSCLAVLFVCAFALAEVGVHSSFGAAFKASVHSKQTAVVIGLRGDFRPNTIVHGSIEGPPPPVGGAPQPFVISIEQNGWPHKTATATFNPETGAWEFSFLIPPGISGGSMSVSVVPFTGDPVVSSIVIV